MNTIMLRRYGAEFLGTFAYVFFGCGTRIFIGYSGDLAGRLIVYLTFGLTLFTMMYALGHISGAPFNPAVIFGFAVARRFPWRYVLPYWLAQIAGALAASATHFALFPERAIAGQFGATIPSVGIIPAVVIEAIITFFLMLVSLTSTDKRVNQATIGLAVGLTITLGGLFASSLTGGSMNPARSLAPALLAGGPALMTVWIYWVGPLIGTTLGAIVYEALRGGKTYAVEVPEGIFQGLKQKHTSGPYA
jgi:MIP family channel proteins